MGGTFVDQYEICLNVGSVVPLPCLSGFVIRFCGNDYLISWIFSVIIFIYPDLFDSVLLGEFLEGMSLWYIAPFSFWSRITSDEIAEWRMRFVRKLTIVVWILRPTDDSLSPGPCLGNVGCPLWKSVIQCGLLMMTNVDSFSCRMIACYFLVNVIMWNSFLHNVPSVRWCQFRSSFLTRD